MHAGPLATAHVCVLTCGYKHLALRYVPVCMCVRAHVHVGQVAPLEAARALGLLLVQLCWQDGHMW